MSKIKKKAESRGSRTPARMIHNILTKNDKFVQLIFDFPEESKKALEHGEENK